ncbi:NO-inducible flavohemoprotein [Pseudomonas sp. nanlin1]|uniref:NO-inducible flavohemoprotein n=1 Tax=Pseudomonas sp. nanlin1 TaxID=3040605 RepID=UPI00388FD1B5
MLSQAHRDIVRDTVPLLETGGEVLTTHFYAMMLREYPEVRPLFNQAHQANGDQPRALANAVLMYARNIERLDQLGGLVSTIVNKHVALQILPEHYPIVGKCLLRAIEEVLGKEVATPAVIAAWAAAYGQLADILMGVEEQAYQEKADTPGGWRGARSFRLERRVVESAEISSLYFVPVDGDPVLRHQPGQYLGLKLLINGQEHRRNYSLSAMADGVRYRISVKREPGGVVSNFLHDDLAIGGVVEVFPPSGEFVLAPGDKPVALISAGVGITPTLAMLEAALQTSRPVYFIHCARSRAAQAFAPWLQSLAAQHKQLRCFYRYEDEDGRLDDAALADWLPRERNLDAYFLGPKGFMAAVQTSLRALGVPQEQCRYEFFGPAAALH